MTTISIVGLGYIGLPTGITAALSGYQVYGFDIDKKKVENINAGVSPIIENGLNEKLNIVLKNKSFKAYNRLQVSDVFVVAVPTPVIKQFSNYSGKQADLSYVFDAAKKIAKVLKRGDLVILESTISVGTTAKIAKFIEKETGFVLSKDFFVSHCPERVLPGHIFEELVANARVVGGVCDKSSELSKKFYSKFVKGEIFITDDKTAEMVKLVENSYRDLNIAFANEVSCMAKQADINPYKLIELANKHPRVNVLSPGCGVGGHCIAVDPWFLIQTFPKHSQMVRTARLINDSRPYIVIDEILTKINNVKNKEGQKPKVLLLGLTFKSDVDDLRGSPALKIAKDLDGRKDTLNLAIIEPNLKEEVLRNFNFRYFLNLVGAVEWADLIVILVGHKKFLELRHFDLNDKIIIDEVGLLEKLENYDNSFIAPQIKKFDNNLNF